MHPDEKRELAQIAFDLARDYDRQYGCCPQCVLAAVQETIEVGDDALIQAAHTLSGGGGLMLDGTCGAVTGGLLAIGAKYGRPRDSFGKRHSMKSFVLGKALMRWFQQEYGGVTCAHIQQKYTGRTFDMWDAKSASDFKGSDCSARCADLTGAVARWVVENI